MAVRSVDPATLHQWLADTNAVLVDVREPAEHRISRIAGAKLMPLSSVYAPDLPAAGKIVIYCQKGGRGNAASLSSGRRSPAGRRPLSRCSEPFAE